jgi:hypothetical protein
VPGLAKETTGLNGRKPVVNAGSAIAASKKPMRKAVAHPRLKKNTVKA